jgi:hypothetical protein
VAQTMCTHVSKCKNDRILKMKKKKKKNFKKLMAPPKKSNPL